MRIVGVFFAVAVILAIYGGASYYIGWNLFDLLDVLLPVNPILFAVIYALLAMSILAALLPLPAAVRRVMNGIGSYWMGMFIYFLTFFLLMDMVILLASKVNLIPDPVPQSIRLYGDFAVFVITIGFVGYGLYHAKQIQHVSYDIQTKASSRSPSMHMVLISDLHLGAVHSETRLKRIVEKVNQLHPDMVCIAGDLFNDDYDAIQDPEAAISLFQKIKSTYGVYACLGNHDSGKTFDNMIRFLERSHIKLLNDEHVIIDDRLALFGRVDASPIGGFGGLKRKDIREQIAALDANLPIVVMDHTPNRLEEYGEEVDLVLSGHTHKGQIFPGNLITKAVFEVDYGYYRKDASSPHVIVTSGASTWGMPMRVGSNNEIVSIQLHFAAS